MRKLLFIAIAVFGVATAVAQGTEIRAGLNLANINQKNVDTNNRVSFFAGIASQIPFTDNFGAEVGAFYSEKGSEWKQTILLVKTEVKTKLSYLEIPVNAYYKYDLNGINLVGKIGPYMGIALAGKDIVKMTYFNSEKLNTETTKKYEFGYDPKHDLKRFDFGLNFGLGLEIRSITIGAQYGLGLSDLSNNSNSKTNRVISFSVGYRIM